VFAFCVIARSEICCHLFQLSVLQNLNSNIRHISILNIIMLLNSTPSIFSSWRWSLLILLMRYLHLLFLRLIETPLLIFLNYCIIFFWLCLRMLPRHSELWWFLMFLFLGLCESNLIPLINKILVKLCFLLLKRLSISVVSFRTRPETHMVWKSLPTQHRQFLLVVRNAAQSIELWRVFHPIWPSTWSMSTTHSDSGLRVVSSLFMKTWFSC
jgi:hypothetical protein